MIEPIALSLGFRPEDYFEASSLPRVRTFNEAELIARRLLQRHPPDAPVALSKARVHVLLIGLGSVGRSILLQLARVGHYRSGLKPKVTIVSRSVKAQWQDVLAARPQLADLLQVEIEESRIESIGESELERWIRDESPVTMVYVCTKDEIANLRIARLLLTKQDRFVATGSSTMAQIVALDPPGGCVLSEFVASSGYAGRFRLFSLLSDADDADATIAGGLLSDADDRRAKQIHDAYCADDNARCAKDPARRRADFNMHWDALPENVRCANRMVADHFEVKLRAVGRRVVRRGDDAEAPLDAAEMEVLASMEHARWTAERRLDGWSFGPVRDNGRKLHPCLVPFEQLSAEIQQLDRNSVNEMINVLASENLVVARQAGQA